ncbi:hypothetical protein SCAR479_12221 [Seiridium cardinale]|uniref:Ankyrin repeat protein n=1 Tax=Seiridium cardinale TaxID=138064 RepID=A0ABR2XBQ1_9PEZI
MAGNHLPHYTHSLPTGNHSHSGRILENRFAALIWAFEKGPNSLLGTIFEHCAKSDEMIEYKTEWVLEHNRTTPLIIAIDNLNLLTVKDLLRLGANANIPCRISSRGQITEWYPFVAAVRGGKGPMASSWNSNSQSDILELLLNRGVDPNRPAILYTEGAASSDWKSLPPLTQVMQKSSCAVEWIDWLMKAGANPLQEDARYPKERTPLLAALVRPESGVNNPIATAKLKALLKYMPRDLPRTTTGDSLITEITEIPTDRRLEILRILLTHGLNPDYERLADTQPTALQRLARRMQNTASREFDQELKGLKADLQKLSVARFEPWHSKVWDRLDELESSISTNKTSYRGIRKRIQEMTKVLSEVVKRKFRVNKEQVDLLEAVKAEGCELPADVALLERKPGRQGWDAKDETRQLRRQLDQSSKQLREQSIGETRRVQELEKKIQNLSAERLNLGYDNRAALDRSAELETELSETADELLVLTELTNSLTEALRAKDALLEQLETAMDEKLMVMEENMSQAPERNEEESIAGRLTALCSVQTASHQKYLEERSRADEAARLKELEPAKASQLQKQLQAAEIESWTLQVKSDALQDALNGYRQSNDDLLACCHKSSKDYQDMQSQQTILESQL